jgi:phosphate transport system permease protein
MAGGETLAVHLWYVMGIGLVPDRIDIANGISALLILVVLLINLIFIGIQKKVA